MNSRKFAKDDTIRSMRIISLNVGLPSAQRYEGREVITGGAKKPVPRAVLRFGNFEGDGQADLVNHGGLEKTVCVYPFDHYPYWNRQLGRDLKPGAFSENLTISGAIETEVCVGDVLQIGKRWCRSANRACRAPSWQARMGRRCCPN